MAILNMIYWGELKHRATQWPTPSWFHVPTNDDWQEIMDIWDALSLWDTSIWDSPNTISTYLKLPFSWRLSPSSWNHEVSWSLWAYWTVERYSTDKAFDFAFSNMIYFPNKYTKWYWLSIRPFKNIPVVPDSSWTALYSDKIYHNATLGLISLSSDWINWITIADKNLWATTVYNSWDILSESNCGKFYQWGNNYWFAWTWATTTSSTQVDASPYWPWNYYISSTFITSSSEYWDTSDNWNLRWWEDGNVPV